MARELDVNVKIKMVEQNIERALVKSYELEVQLVMQKASHQKPETIMATEKSKKSWDDSIIALEEMLNGLQKELSENK